jgi:hypothetical protein
VRDPNGLSIPFDDVGLQLGLGLFSGAVRYLNQFEDRPCKRRPLRHATDAIHVAGMPHVLSAGLWVTLIFLGFCCKNLRHEAAA